MPLGYEPGAIAPRLTFASVATPRALVVALPFASPFSVQLTVCPSTGVAPWESVAESVTVPPKLPDAADAARSVSSCGRHDAKRKDPMRVCQFIPLLS